MFKDLDSGARKTEESRVIHCQELTEKILSRVCGLSKEEIKGCILHSTLLPEPIEGRQNGSAIVIFICEYSKGKNKKNKAWAVSCNGELQENVDVEWVTLSPLTGRSNGSFKFNRESGLNAKFSVEAVGGECEYIVGDYSEKWFLQTLWARSMKDQEAVLEAMDRRSLRASDKGFGMSGFED